MDLPKRRIKKEIKGATDFELQINFLLFISFSEALLNLSRSLLLEVGFI